MNVDEKGATLLFQRGHLRPGVFSDSITVWELSDASEKEMKRRSSHRWPLKGSDEENSKKQVGSLFVFEMSSHTQTSFFQNQC